MRILLGFSPLVGCRSGWGGSRRAAGRSRLPLSRFPTIRRSHFASPVLDKGTEEPLGASSETFGVSDGPALPPRDPVTRVSCGTAWQDRQRGLGEEKSGGEYARAVPDASLAPVFLSCLISLELLQACVRASPSSPLLQQKSGRAL